MSKATFVEQTVDPAIPASGRVTLYAKNNFLFSIDDLGQTTPLTGGSQLPDRAIVGLEANYTSVSSLTIQTGTCRDDTDSFDMGLSAPAVVDITASGFNGLDTGGENANSWYSVWIIDDSTGTNPAGGLLSLSPTSPTMPGGYDTKRLVMWVRNHTGDFFRWTNVGAGSTKTVFYDEQRNAAPQRILSGGGATSFSTVNGATVIPPTPLQVIFNCQVSSTTQGTQVRPNGFIDPGGNFFVRQSGSSQFELPIGDQQIQYSNTGASGSFTLGVVGFRLEV